MAIDFSKFAYQPRPLQQWDIGEGLNDIIQGNRAREVAGRQERQFQQNRGDTQAQFSANFAKTQGDDQYKAAGDSYQKRVALVNAATLAARKGQYSTARALLPRILELGGEGSESGTLENPIFRFKAGSEPARAPLDIGGARQQIYGGAQPRPGGNPMDPPALPGASAAAMTPQTTNQGPPPAGALPSQTGAQSPPVDAAGPPPGAAIDGPRRPPPGAAWLPPGMEQGAAGEPPPGEPAPATPAPITSESSGVGAGPTASVAPPAAQQPQPGSPQFTGPNPFDPYTIDTAREMASNQLRLDPMLKGITDAVPSRFRSQVEQFGRGLSGLRMDPEATLTAARPWFGELTNLYGGQMAAEGQSGRLDAMRANQQSIQENKDRADARGVANKVIENENLKKVKIMVQEGKTAATLLEGAGSNPNIANSLIESLYKMKNTGVMTDADFERSSVGVQSLWSRLKNQTLNQLFQPNGGFNPDVIRDIKELIEYGTRTSRSAMTTARDSMHRAWQSAPTDSHKQVYDESIRIFFPPEYLPEEFRQPWEKGGGGEEVPTINPEDEQAEMERLAAEEGNLGVVDVPGAPSGSYAGPGVRGKRVPPKPPRGAPSWKGKDPKDMTTEQMLEAARELRRKAEEQ